MSHRIVMSPDCIVHMLSSTIVLIFISFCLFFFFSCIIRCQKSATSILRRIFYLHSSTNIFNFNFLYFSWLLFSLLSTSYRRPIWVHVSHSKPIFSFGKNKIRFWSSDHYRFGKKTKADGTETKLNKCFSLAYSPLVSPPSLVSFEAIFVYDLFCPNGYSKANRFQQGFFESLAWVCLKHSKNRMHLFRVKGTWN